MITLTSMVRDQMLLKKDGSPLRVLRANTPTAKLRSEWDAEGLDFAAVRRNPFIAFEEVDGDGNSMPARDDERPASVEFPIERAAK